MKHPVKALVILLFSLILFGPVVSLGGTVDNASLTPSEAVILPDVSQSFTFSALNDKVITLQSYYIKILYTRGLSITNLSVSPAADTSSINTKKYYIELIWSNVAPGTELQASFDLSAGLGDYSLNPETVTYTDGNGDSFTVSCNSSTIAVKSDIVAPATPNNIRSETVDGSIAVYWDPPSDTDIDSYKVYRRTGEESFPASEYDTTTQASYVDQNIDADVVYYYAVAAVDTAGNESDLSDQTAQLYHDPVSRVIDVSAIMVRNTVPNGVAATGDLNGDGLEDLVLGFPDLNTNKKPGGHVVVYFGGNMTSEPDIQMHGGVLNGFFGHALAIVDMNNDGYDELIVGAPGFDAEKSSDTAWDAGKIFLYEGSPQFEGIPLFTMEGDFAYGPGVQYLTSEELGWAMAEAGDVNGDGYQDVVIGAPSGGYNRSGSVFILYGSATLSGYMNMKEIQGPGVDDFMGYILSGVGDFNDDGYDDICAGAKFDPNIFLILGGQTPQLSGNSFYGSNENGRIAGGDFNGDGIADFVLSEPPPIGSSISSLEIFLGSDSIDYASDAVISYSTAGMLSFRNYVGVLGDLDGDGTTDILANGPQLLWGDSNQDFVLSGVGNGQYMIGCGDLDNNGSEDAIAFDNNEDLVTMYNVAPYAGAPLITIDAPTDGYVSDTRSIEITGFVKREIAKLLIYGEQVTVSPQGDFSHTVYLKSESNLIECIAISPGGMISKRQLNLSYNIQPLSIDIISTLTVDPATNTVEVNGTVSDPLANVSVNGVDAQMTGNSFTAIVTIDGATTQITAQADDDFGQVATQSIDTIQLAPENQCAVAGTVADAQGAPLSGATVTLTDSLGLEYVTTSDTSGKYHLFTPNPGNFTLKIFNTGYFEKTLSGSLLLYQTLFNTVSPTQLSVTITYPNEGNTLNSSSVTVWGTFNPDPDATITVNGTTASIIGSQFHATVDLVEGPNTITAEVSDPLGQSVTDSVSINLVFILPNIWFNGISEIEAGSPGYLAWVVDNADIVTIDNGIGDVPADHEWPYTVYPLETTTYTLTATGPGGTATATHTITVTQPPMPEITFQASPTDILTGQSSTLTWDVLNAQTVSIDNGIGTVNASGSTVVSPLVTTTYTLTATGIIDTVTESVTVTVTSPGPTISFNATPATIAEGETATLSWDVTEADTVSIDNGIGTVSATGATDVSPAQTTTYTLTATGPEGTNTESVTVTVTPPKPIVNLTASPGSLSVATGGTITLLWNCQLAEDAILFKMVAGNPLPVANGLTGIYNEQIDVGETYILQAEGPGGISANQVNFTVWESSPIDITLQATPDTITSGQFIDLTWNTSGATDVFIDNGAEMNQQAVADSGTLSLAPLVTTTYVLTAYNQELMGSSAYVTVNVSGDPPAPTISFSADPQDIFTGEQTTLAWNVDYADSVSIDQGIGDVAAADSLAVSPGDTITYTLTATGLGGTSTSQVIVTVAPPVPTVLFNADVTTLNAGESATLTWSTTNADTVSIDQDIGDVALNDSIVVFPTIDTTYTITATGPGGTATDTVTITVISPITLQILSPTDGVSLNRPDVMVHGTFVNATGKETGITVNGKVAMVYGNEFVVNHVPLEEGANTITVIATDVDGYSQTATAGVTTTIPEHYIGISANIEAANAPLEVALRINGTFSIDDSVLNYNGSATVDFLESGYDAYRVGMIDEGIYYFTAEVVHEAVTYTDTVAIVVVDASALDALLQQKWADMKTKLSSGDITGALGYYSEGTKPIFEYNFNLLSDHIGEIIAGMQSVTLVKISEDQAVYNLVGEQGGQTFSFYLLFIKSSDGIWRIVNF